jgi:Saxitoxin biosynthesis operon protein SxtJ
MPPPIKTEKPARETASSHRSGSSHEMFWRPDEAPGPSNRLFGLTFAGVFAALGVISLWRGLERGIWEVGLAIALLAVATFAPGSLGPLNRAWTWIGRGLNRVISPLLIIVLFYGVVMPAGLAMRAVGKDPLRLRRDPQSSSYWIDCRDGSQISDMRRQF